MESIIKSFSDHGTFVQPDALDYILSQQKPEEFTNMILKNLREYPLVLTSEQIKNIELNTKEVKIPTPPPVQSIDEKELQKKVLADMYGGVLQPQPSIDENDLEYDDPDKDDEIQPENAVEEPTTPPVIEIKKVKGWRPKAKDYDSEIQIIKDVTGNSLCEGTTQDFTKLFINRFNTLKRILQSQRREMANALPINRMNRSSSNDVQLIGIVKDIRTTVNGHRLLELEDDTGTATCIALKNNRDVLQLANEIILDEIVGLKGKISKNGDLVIIQSIIFPDISLNKNRNKAEIPIYAAFLSDIHVGSKMFMEKQWHACLRWLNGEVGNSRQKDVAGKIKYIVIPGDVIDGIGIYPNQEKELAITDVYRQYEALAEQLQLIPDHISVIMQPGNHDAVRPAEPQPTFEKEIQNLFSGIDIKFAGNPCYFSLHGVEILSYHGQSLLDYSMNIQHLDFKNPIDTMKTMLKKHHLAPTYGGYTPLAPEHHDYMVIDRVPDIFVTGHVHLATIGDYRGVTLINASSWQAQTIYQKNLNFVPDSAKLPIVDLKSTNVTMMDFNTKF